MRKRTINPNFFTDTKTGRLSITSQMLFIGMWCLADREGYIEYDVDFIKIQIFPYQRIDIKNNMDELLKNNLVIKIEKQNKKLLQIVDFATYQNIHPHEADSIYIENKRQNYLYILNLSSESENFIKIGISSNIKTRYKYYKSFYNLNELQKKQFPTLTEARDMEKLIKKYCSVYSHVPKTKKFDGYSECFSMKAINIIRGIIDYE